MTGGAVGLGLSWGGKFDLSSGFSVKAPVGEGFYAGAGIKWVPR